MVILDTNVIIDHIRQQNQHTETYLMKLVRSKPKESLALSLVSIQELYEGQSTKDEVKEQYLLSTIAPLKILAYTYEVAQLAGKLMRDAKQRLELADAAIAATAIVNNCQLLTLNKRDFSGIKDLVFLEVA